MQGTKWKEGLKSTSLQAFKEMLSQIRPVFILASKGCKTAIESKSKKGWASLRPLSSIRSQFNLAAPVNQPVNIFSKRKFSTKMEGEIVHDKSKKVFFVQLNNDGGRAVLDYEIVDPKTLDFYHTGVPVSHRGKGIAKELVKAGFDYVISENLKVIPTCSYVLKYVNEHLDDKNMKNNVILS